MIKRTISIIGMVVGAMFVFFGILAMSGALGGDTYYASTAPYNYDSGFATFGGDYYTYSVNNSGEAASGALTAASNLREISDFLKAFCGIFMMGIGLLSVCGFGIVFVGCEKTAKIQEVIEEDIEQEEIAEETIEEAFEETSAEIIDEEPVSEITQETEE